MLEVNIPEVKFVVDETNEIINIPKTHLTLEHSLISVRKWESKWKRPFLEKRDKTPEELIDYIRCMTVNSNVNPLVYNHLTNKNLLEITKYIEDPMTATVITRSKKEGAAPKKEIVTAEVVYYWMFTLGIPIELERWHFNQLIMLIEVFGELNKPKKKRGRIDTIKDWARLNEERRKAMKSKG